MGWRKLTVRDGDLARCCAAQGPIICEASLGVCFDAAASSLAGRQWTTAADQLGRLSPRQSGPCMRSSTLQRSLSPRLGCRTAFSKLRGMTSRPVLSRPTAGDCACLLWEFPCLAYGTLWNVAIVIRCSSRAVRIRLKFRKCEVNWRV